MKNKNLIQSFNNAINGILHTIRNEKNMKIHIVAAILILILSLFYNLNRIELIIILLVIGFVFVCELFNTAIEVLVDLVVDEYHPKAKIVKDVAAGAVMVAAFLSVFVAYFIFIDRISTSFEIGIHQIRESPLHVIIIALLITVIGVLCLKAYYKRGSFLQGGMPSGHAALAFCISTAIALWSTNIHITVLSFALAVLVAESRIESKIHNIYEVAIGGFLGFLISLVIFQVVYNLIGV
jgi:diacylglycerol kinase (ATP)